MLIFKISQRINNDYDTYSDAIVVSNSPEEARLIHPSGDSVWNDELNAWCYSDDLTQPCWSHSWVKPEEVAVELIGVAHASGSRVLCASYHAG